MVKSKQVDVSKEVKQDTKPEPKQEKPRVPSLTGADKIWNKIKDFPIDIYALPNQVVSQHVKREEKMEKVLPDALHVIFKSAAVLPALEDVLQRVRLGPNEMFELTQSARYTVIKIVPRAD